MAELENETEIQWVKHGGDAFTCILGKDVVVLASGNFITFVETSRPNKKEIVYEANNELRGDGVQYICTHKTLPCFAFAEKCRNPRILILFYPNLEIVKSLESVTDTNYIALRFSEMEFLVALTGIVDYKIVIWNWRTGEKLYSQETQLQSSSQIIRVSPTSPIQIMQYGVEDNRLLLWDMNFCYKKTLLQKTSISLPENSFPPYCFIYGADGNIYFVDFGGSLYSINSETHLCSLQYSCSKPQSSKFIPCITWYKGGIVFAIPSEILFLRRKSPEGWVKIWSFTSKTFFTNLMASNVKDFLVGVSATNEIIFFKGENQIECVTIKNFGADFEFLGFVNPVGNFFVTYGNLTKAFHLWNKTNGQKVSELQWTKERINALKSNPKWPYLVAVTEKGSAHVISASESNKLIEFGEIILTTNTLNEIRFRSQGTQFCVANMDIGEFFLLKVQVFAKIEMIAYVKLDLKIVDYVVLNKEINGVTLLIVPMSQMCCRSGQTVLLYALREKKKTFEYLKDVKMPTVVTAILPSPTTPKEIFCVPHRSRKLYVVNFFDGKMVVEFVSGHQMKLISLKSDEEYLYTFGIDGLVIVKLAGTKNCATLFSSHHRLERGIKTLVVDPYVNYVITLGENGSLVCTYLKKFGIDESRTENLRSNFEALLSTPAYKQLFTQLTQLTQFTAKPKTTKKQVQEQKQESLFGEKETVWLLMRQEEMINLEEQQSRNEKQSILEEFTSIKQKVCHLLDANLKDVPEKRLSIQAFDLDIAVRQKKHEEAKIEREREKLYQIVFMENLNKLTDLIKNVCWESVSVKSQEIHGIMAPISVQNYALFSESNDFNNKMAWISELRKVHQFFNLGNFFDPWVPRTASALEDQANKKFQMSVDVTQTIKAKYEETQAVDEKINRELEKQMPKDVWSGTSTFNFVEADPKHYSQFELTTFFQAHQEIYFIQNDIKKLMLWFNKNFTEMFELKKQEMALVFERNNRFRHIINELNFFHFSSDICKTQIYDPEWVPKENPETIMVVQDKEITVPKYISNSEMDLIKKKEDEEEKLKQLLMADDFKEKALITMMDGVLERVWEDKIKKEIPKPKCMTDKDPETWTEEDLKAYRAYEDAVKFLARERERYRKILEVEWAKTVATVKESVSKFDEEIAKLHVLKLKVESAIGQETLKSLRIRLKCFERIELTRKEEAIASSLVKSEKKMESISAELSVLSEMLNECKNFYENLLIKGKNLEKNFKKEFPEYSPIVCEQLYKLSKKRPKLMQKAATSPTVLNDMGRCAVLGTKPDYIPNDCIQYLKDIDALDAFSNAPASVTQKSWELACKLRRMKIEMELKIRACAIDLADAEATVAAYQKTLKATRENHVHLQNELQAIRAEKIQDTLNHQIQLVLKKGLIEVPLSGRISDFSESILITSDTVNQVNKAIQKMGQQKLKAMRNVANFRKGIIYKEWEHKKLSMEIEDLKGQLNTVEKLQVLKELQAILVARARGFSEEKGFLYLENELNKVKEKFEKAQSKIFNKMNDLNSKAEKLKVKNQELDLRILELNVEMNELNLSRDVDFEKKNLEENMKRMKKFRERNNIMRKIQEQHNEILVLQTELELLRLKTYPTIKGENRNFKKKNHAATECCSLGYHSINCGFTDSLEKLKIPKTKRNNERTLRNTRGKLRAKLGNAKRALELCLDKPECPC